MPHIVLDKIVNMELLSLSFEQIFQKEEKSIIKINEFFVHSKKHNALLHTVTIEKERHQEYFIEISTRELGTTIRLFPLTDPIKTDAVKKSLVLVYELVKKHYPAHRIAKTNLQGFISDKENT